MSNVTGAALPSDPQAEPPESMGALRRQISGKFNGCSIGRVEDLPHVFVEI